MAEKKKKLNKGLDAIFGGDITSLIDDIEHNTPESSQEKIKLDEIRPNPYQPRKVFDEQALNELALSIQEHGIFQPVILKKSVQGYEIVAGERRCRAARMAHLAEVPAIIVDFSDQQMMEIALLENKAHAAIHSMKDVPYEMGKHFELIAMPEREDVRDVLVCRNGLRLEELKKGAIFGTSSIRRAAQIKNIRNDLNIVPIRGNVGTRLEKMKNENMDGIILAAAGLKRLGMEDIITEYLNPEIFVPAVSQGALGIECLKNGEYNDYFKSLDNKDVRVTVEAERSFMRELNGGCHSLIGAYATLEGNDLYIIGTYEVNGVIVKKDILGNKEDNIELGKKLAQKILMG